jgi:transcriptional regulator with XRE-family HTH domain
MKRSDVSELGTRFARAVHVILVREFIASGVSLGVLAEAAGVDRSALGRWVQSYRPVTLGYALRLSIALGIAPSVLVEAAVGLVFSTSERLRWKPGLRSADQPLVRVRAASARSHAERRFIAPCSRGC